MVRRIQALVRRHLYLLRRSIPRMMGLIFWPVMSLIVWGFITTYLQSVAAPKAVVYLLGSIILWDILFRAQQSVTLAINEEYWSKNIINIFIAPITIAELVAATCIVGLVKACITTGLLSIMALLLYRFNILDIGPALIPYLGCLLLFGWSMGLLTMGLVFRFGQAAEALIWGVPFIIQPISAVFYPVSTLPHWLQSVALALPSTHVFEGMRAVLQTGRLDAAGLMTALTLNLVYLIVGGLVFGLFLKSVREKGLLTKQGMS